MVHARFARFPWVIWHLHEFSSMTSDDAGMLSKILLSEVGPNAVHQTDNSFVSYFWALRRLISGATLQV